MFRKAPIWLTVLLLSTLVVPAHSWASSADARPAYTLEGSRWDVGAPDLPADEVDRFRALWTARFLDSAGLQAYLERPGLYDDGFNTLPQEEKAALVLDLLHHWQATLPGFARGFWSGEAQEDQKRFEELMSMLYATIFAKDEFLASLRDAANAAPDAGPVAETDAGIPEFPGMSQQDIARYYEEIHLAQRVVTERPAAPAVELPAETPLVTMTAPPAPGALLRVEDVAVALVPMQQAPVHEQLPVQLGEPARLRAAAPAPGEPTFTVPVVVPPLSLALPTLPALAVPEANELLNLVAGGTYLACGSVGAGPVRCAPAPVPLGAPVPLDLDGDVLTGVGGMEVTVLLTPAVHPDFLGGFSALLRVDRTQPSALPLATALPAQVYVVYAAPGAATQIMAGFSGLSDTLGDTQSVQVTLQDVALALAGDVRILGEITREGPGSEATLLAGFSRVDPTQFPLQPADPTRLALSFEPAPASVVADLRFAEGLIEGTVESSISPTVTAAIEMTNGQSHRELLGIVESMPSELSFRIESEAVGATMLQYAANAPFPRFELHDVLTPDVATPAVRTTLDAIVHGVPDEIEFQLSRPFGVTYAASARVTDATVNISSHDAGGLVSAIEAHVEGIPAHWSVTGDDAPLRIAYTADGNIDLATASMYDRAAAMQVDAYVEDIPNALDLTVADDRLVATAAQPIGTILASMRLGGLQPTWMHGEFASLRADGAGGLAAAARVVGFTSLDIDQRTANRVLANVRIAGGEPFTARLDTPDAYLNARLSNLPTDITLDLRPNTFSYDMAQSVANVTIHAEIADLAADVIVEGLPSSLDLTWNATSLVYDANAPITRVRTWVARTGMLAHADVQTIPADFTVSWPNGTASFSTPTALGSVLVQASVNGGSVVALVGDHASLTRNGTKLGASLKLSGIKAASVDPRNGGNYSLTLSPGGQTFRAAADLDGLLAQAYVSNLPQTISVDLRTGSSRFAYNASAPIARVWATADAATGPLYAHADLIGLPARVDLSWTLGSAPSIVYNASSSVTSIYGYLRSATNAVYEANVTSLPPYLSISSIANDLRVDTRTAWNAAPASGTVGGIVARYGSDGIVLYGAGDHAGLYQAGNVTRATLGYSGLKALRMSQANDNLVLDVQNSAPRYFNAWADTPEAFLSVVIDSIPARVNVTGTGTVFTYNAYGQTISEISAYFWDRESLTASASVRGIPGTATIDLNMPSSTLAYTASSAITAIDVDVWYDVWYGKLRISGVPTAWTASFGGGDYKFDAGAASIGSVEAVVTNHGTWSAPSGNHVALNFVQGTGGGGPIEVLRVAELATDTIDASLLMTQVQKAQYKRVGANNELDLRMGGGTPFTARADVVLNSGVKAYVNVWFSPLPSSIQASFGEKTTISTNANFVLLGYGHYGTQAALDDAPTPPWIHGASVRDGSSGAQRAVKALVYLTGLPTSVTLDPKNGTFAFTNFRPTTSTLTIDGELDDLLATPVDVYVQLTGIPNPQSLTFQMRSEDVGGTKRVDVDLTQTAPMGTLFADATYGPYHGRLTVSNIPDDIHALYEMANGAGTFTWDATAPINEVYAGFRVTTQSVAFQGYVDLDQLPSDFSLAFGRASGGQGPTLSYNANANTLDVTTFVDASLFGGDLKARLSFGLVNLGSDVDIYTSGTGLRFTSVPATTSVHAAVWGTYNYYTSGSGVWDAGGFLEYPWEYHLGVNPTVNNLQVTLTNFSDFNLAWGVTTKMWGSYGAFSLGWDQINVGLDVYGRIRIVVDWPAPFGSSDITVVSAHVHQTITVNALFHKYTNHEGYWFGVSGSVICDYSLGTTIRPHPHGTEWNGLTVTAGGAEGGAWYATPNPWGALSPWVMDLATRYSSQDGGNVGLSFSFDCI